MGGSVPPLPSMAEIARVTNEPDEAARQMAEVPAEPHDPTRLSTIQSEEFRGVLIEIASRRVESLRLFEPMEEQERFFASDAGERIALGGNRGGKTTVTCVEIARAVTGQDPHDKYPKTGGKAILCGKDLTHCSKVFYEKLFNPGAFKIIRDLDTGLWRTYNPNDPADKARAREAKKAPALIPARWIKSIAWENKKDQQPKTIQLINGWSLHFFSSNGAPPQGWNVDLVAFDEEIEHPLWYAEMAARLLDNQVEDPETGKIRSGKFIWSATPQSGTQQLYDLYCRAEKVKDDPKRPIEVFEFGMLGNKWVSDRAKAEFIAKWEENPDEIAVRVHGQFALLGTRVYSEFMPDGVHGVESFPIPEDWTVYCAIDPGRQVCAVLFVAVPPTNQDAWVALRDGKERNFRGRKVVFDELYIKKCDAKKFADTFVRQVNGRPIEFGIVDHRAGRITEIGSGKTHEQQYSDALKVHRFKFERGGYDFQWSNDDVQGGIAAVHNALHIVEGQSDFIFMKEKLPQFCKEMERYSYRKLPNGTVTDEPIKLNDHACDCLRYLAMGKLRYVRPRKRTAAVTYAVAFMRAKNERAKRKAESSGKHGSIKVG